MSWNFLATSAFLLMASLLLTSQAVAEKPIDFNRDVRPILSDKCFFCHGPDPTHREADLRLDVEKDAKDYAIVPGKPEASDVFQRIISTDADEKMPPEKSGKKLSSKEIAILKKWIEQGADYAPYWAYLKPKRHPIPDVRLENWPRNWIDNFLLARLEEEGLNPSRDADKVTLIRRVTFDLTGLPPTPEDVAAFLADKGPNALEKVVDRLLASDHYGERMAVYWLDLVRYADTVGYHGDQDHNISPYRDYVINAFNANMKFDRFTREQLAGDLLPNPTLEQRVATGYNRLLQTSHEGGVQPKEYLAIYAADRVRNVSSVWMGATVGCAQCHDHKYDPYSLEDFYSLASFFADVDEAQHFKRGTNSLPTARPPEIPVPTPQQQKQLQHLRDRLAALEKQAERQPEVDKDSEGGKNSEKDDQPKEPVELKRLRKQIANIEKSIRKTMITVSIKPREMRILPRGNWLDDSGPVVTPAVPKFLTGTFTVPGENNGERLTRLQLANWLIDADNGAGGLTSRVMVNRFWYLLFGMGISRSLDDFGGQGEPPVHPELLDNLAIEFVENRWDIKQILKTIVLSRAYQQSSLVSDELRQRDPDNRLYARQSRHRLPAEMVRDNALAISGLLNRTIGGPSVKPYQPAGYYRHLNFPQRRYAPHKDNRQWRRGVYVHWQRQFLHPMLKAFDAPTREECTAERPRSNTPLAALALLNDPTFVEAARVFATRILQDAEPKDAARLDFAFQRALSRKPDDVERKILTAHLLRTRAEYTQDSDAARALTGIGLAPMNDDVDVVELATWTAIARAVLNLNETNTRN